MRRALTVDLERETFGPLVFREQVVVDLDETPRAACARKPADIRPHPRLPARVARATTRSCRGRCSARVDSSNSRRSVPQQNLSPHRRWRSGRPYSRSSNASINSLRAFSPPSLLYDTKTPRSNAGHNNSNDENASVSPA